MPRSSLALFKSGLEDNFWTLPDLVSYEGVMDVKVKEKYLLTDATGMF